MRQLYRFYSHKDRHVNVQKSLAAVHDCTRLQLQHFGGCGRRILSFRSPDYNILHFTSKGYISGTLKIPAFLKYDIFTQIKNSYDYHTDMEHIDSDKHFKRQTIQLSRFTPFLQDCYDHLVTTATGVNTGSKHTGQFPTLTHLIQFWAHYVRQSCSPWDLESSLHSEEVMASFLSLLFLTAGYSFTALRSQFS